MKRLRDFAVMMAVVFMPLYSSSCGEEDGDEEKKEEPAKDKTTTGENETSGSDNETGIDSGVPQSIYGPFIEYINPQSFYDSYESYSGAKVLIDYRSAELYAEGHLSGAVNMPATVYNIQSDDAQWCMDLLEKYPASTCLFFYGTGSFEMSKIVAGRASKIGYGKEHSRIYSKSYDDLKSIWK